MNRDDGCGILIAIAFVALCAFLFKGIGDGQQDARLDRIEAQLGIAEGVDGG